MLTCTAAQLRAGVKGYCQTVVKDLDLERSRLSLNALQDIRQLISKYCVSLCHESDGSVTKHAGCAWVRMHVAELGFRWRSWKNDKLDRSYRCTAEIPMLVHGVWNFVSVCCPAPGPIYIEIYLHTTTGLLWIMICDSILSSNWQKLTQHHSGEFTDMMRSMSEALAQICTNRNLKIFVVQFNSAWAEKCCIPLS